MKRRVKSFIALYANQLLLAVVLVPLILTWYVWKNASESAFRQNAAKFESLAMESEKALVHRIESYNSALLGGAGFFQGSDFVSPEEWRNYVETIDVKRNFPGISGLGWIKPVDRARLEEFVREQRKERPDFAVHPLAETGPAFVITYIDPNEDNKQAIGLDIAFEQNRRQAAELSRDTGKSVITKRIVLVQDEHKRSGFLLLHPLYERGLPLHTKQGRRRAFLGWVYAPFVADDFMRNLTASQGHTINIRIYDGDEESPENLIYSSYDETKLPEQPTHQVRKHLTVMQQKWLIVWDSTLVYDQAERRDGPLMILAGGVLFTILVGVFMTMLTARHTDAVPWLMNERRMVLPFVIFAVTVVASFYLRETLQMREWSFVRTIISEEAKKIEQLITTQTEGKLLALRRMGQRWEVAGRTPQDQWQADALNYTNHLTGLKAVEWVDSTFHVRWVEPLKGNEMAVGLNVVFDKQREEALKGAAERYAITITPPLDLVQGYKAFIAYSPIRVRDEFDGFMVGIFSIEEYIGQLFSGDISYNYAVYLSHDGKEFYRNANAELPLEMSLAQEKTLQIYDKQWVMRLVPTQRYVRAQLTQLPSIVFVGGLLIAVLLMLTVRYVLLARIKSADLLAREEQMRMLVRNTPAAVAMFDLEMKYIMTSARWIQDYQLEDRQIIGKSHYEIFPEILSMPKWMDIHKRALSGEVFDLHEESWVRDNGAVEWVKWAIHPWFDTKGNIGGVVMFTEVITPRKVAEAALRRSEETFRLAMEHASIGMGLTDPTGRWLKVNQALCDLLGYEREELLVNDSQSISHPDDLPAETRQAERLLEGRIPSFQMEMRYFHKTGRTIWTLLSVSLVHNDEGAPQYFVLQIQDITERKEVERIKSEFISIVSHELRTPLTSIRGSLGLIVGAMAKEIPEKALKLIDIAHKNSERLILLINDILDIDKIASGQMRFDMKAEKLEALIHQAVEANIGYAQKLGVTVVMHPVDPGLYIKTDAARFTQVLTNLLSNAAKFSPAGADVEVAVRTETGVVRISVTDDGPGIAEEFHDRVFAKFSQEDSSVRRSKGGTGLGLHITKQIVEHMGGKIGFDTEIGVGTTFWIEFGVLKPAQVLQPATGGEVVALPSPEGLPLILHVEDDADFSNVLASALLGHAQIVTATTLEAAKTLIMQYPFALILLDVEMPDGSGLGLLELDVLTKTQVPVAILSASEVTEEMLSKVKAAMVKSRMSEARIVEVILGLIGAKNR